MSIIRRLDHPIVCVRDLRQWVPRFERALQLRPGRAREGDEWGFSNAELNVGDGFIGVVEPAGEDSQLHRFLSRKGEGFYGLAVDVGDLAPVAAFLTERGVAFRGATRDGVVTLLWLPPTDTHGVVYQLTSGVAPEAGTNPAYLGISEVVVAVDDLDAAVADYQRVFGFDAAEPTSSATLGYTGARLAMPGSVLDDALVLAAPSTPDGALSRHLAERGEGMFQFTIAVSDLDAEAARLAAAGVAVEQPDVADATPARCWLGPDELPGLRVELRAATVA